MKNLLFRLAALLLAAFTLCSPALAHTLFDQLQSNGNIWFDGTHQIWGGNRIAVGPDAVNVTQVTLNLVTGNGSTALLMRVCEANTANTAPTANCQPFTMDNPGSGGGHQNFTGTFSAAANTNLWVVFGMPSGSGSLSYTVGYNDVTPFPGVSSSDGGATWTRNVPGPSMPVSYTHLTLPTIYSV